jgi:hypothetical protein
VLIRIVCVYVFLSWADHIPEFYGLSSFFFFFPSYLSPPLTFLFLLFSLVASIMTETGVAKNERDTPMRLCDAKDLHGGIRLTTALGSSNRYVQFF